MFSQLRNAVEQLAQQPIRVLDGSSSETQTTEQRSSLDMQSGSRTTSPSSGQLAESAISSLRKSLAAQRTSSANSSQSSKSSATSPPPPESHSSPRKSNLEERLRRATYAISDPSASSPTQRSSRVASPSPMDRKPSVTEQSPARRTESPARRTESPARRTESPARRAESPARRAESPIRRTESLMRRTESPMRRAESPVRRSESPNRRADSPARRAESPVRRVESSVRRAESPARRAGSPLVTSAKSAEKKPSQASPKISESKLKEEQSDSTFTTELPQATQSTVIEIKPAEAPTGEDCNMVEAISNEGKQEMSQEIVTEHEPVMEHESGSVLSEESYALDEKNSLETTLGVDLVSKELELDDKPAKDIPASDASGPQDASGTSPPEGKDAETADLRDILMVKESAIDNTAETTSHQEAISENVFLQSHESKDSEMIASESRVPPETNHQNLEVQAAQQSSQLKESEVVAAEDRVASTESALFEDQAAAEPLLQRNAISIQETSKPSEDAKPAQEVNLQPTGESPLPGTVPPVVDHSAEVESLQARLKQVEQRFSDISTSFKRLQAEKQAADAVLKETTPLESIKDAHALREFFTNLREKDDVFQEEIKRLNQKLELQEDRLEEIRDTHRLESHSLSEEVRKLRTQLTETEALFDAAQRATLRAEETLGKQKEEYTLLQKEVEAAKNTAKEEEEKRVKAISLLKTVRQKLVKAEKDRDDALREAAALKEREKDEKAKEQAERLNFQQEIDALKITHEKNTATLKAQLNKDMANMKDRYEQEISALRGQFELDMAAVKATHTKELGTKTSLITTLENSLNAVTRDKNAFFDQLQLRQAELESAQGHLESLQHQNTEIQFQLREANDRLALLKEEHSELLREQESRSRDPVVSADEIARLVSAAEAKYDSKLAEMKRTVTVLEKERYEAEADWSRKLKEKVKELEDLKRLLGSATRSREADESVVNSLRAELAQAQTVAKTFERQISEFPLLREQIEELQRTVKEQENDSSVKIAVLEKQIEESRAREVQLKQSNKTLREELRKVQSSAALLERQRNPGVGYWTSRVTEVNSPAEPRASISSVDSPSRTSSPALGSSASTTKEEEVNLEYLRNVILQFLEHKEMRPNLVKVLSVILHFTPQETRRLIAKV